MSAHGSILEYVDRDPFNEKNRTFAGYIFVTENRCQGNPIKPLIPFQTFQNGIRENSKCKQVLISVSANPDLHFIVFNCGFLFCNFELIYSYLYF